MNGTKPAAVTLIDGAEDGISVFGGWAYGAQFEAHFERFGPKLFSHIPAKNESFSFLRNAKAGCWLFFRT
jgi:hypothetical protein